MPSFVFNYSKNPQKQKMPPPVVTLAVALTKVGVF